MKATLGQQKGMLRFAELAARAYAQCGDEENARAAERHVAEMRKKIAEEEGKETK